MTEDQPGREDWHLEIGVSFRHNPKIYSFVATGMRVSIGEQVLVRTEKGVDMGEVREIRGRVGAERVKQLMPVVRRATEEDLRHVAEQQQREKQALGICAEAIARHGLPMKLIDASLSFDNTRLVFFFSADGRVDFRELVRDLARTFRMRIELRQIGVRDEAKLLGGLGPCGRRLCCKTFMRDFEPVGIRVAKDQGLALNPSKISGLCDRLMCCLLFEHETYRALRDALPERGERVLTPQGPGTVKDAALLKEEVHVVLDDGTEVRVRASELGPRGSEPPAPTPDAEPPAPPPRREPRGEPEPEPEAAPPAQAEPEPAAGGADEQEQRPKRRRRPRRRRRKSSEASREPQAQQQQQVRPKHSGPRQRDKPGDGGGEGQGGSEQAKSSVSSRRRRGRRRGSRRKNAGQSADQSGAQSQGGGMT